MLKKKIGKLVHKFKKIFEKRKKESVIHAVTLLILSGALVGILYISWKMDNIVVAEQIKQEDKLVPDKNSEDKKEDKKNEEDKQDNNSEENKEEEEKENTINTDTKGDIADSQSNSDENKTPNRNDTNNSANNNNGSNSNDGGSSKPSNNGGSNTSKPSHSHSWSPITKIIHHDEEGHFDSIVVKPAWTETVPVYENKQFMICNDCNSELSPSNCYDHIENHLLNGGKGSWREEYREIQVGSNTVNHDAVYDKKWVVTKAAWDETVTVGESCSCGATK